MAYLRGKIKDDAFFSGILDTMGDLVRVIGPDNTVVYENKALAKVFGKTRKKKCFNTICKNEFCPQCPIYKGIGNKPFKKVSGNVVIADRVYAIDISPTMDAKGETGAVEVFRDITNEYTLRERILTSNKKMLNDLEVARTLQLSILRDQLPDVPDYRFSSIFRPCETLGGDMYDCFKIGKDKVAMYIADVSGHGVMSAMLTVYLRQEIFSQFKKHDSPDEVLYGLYESYHDLNIENSVYITVFVLVLDLKTGQFIYTNAGHSVAPLLYDGKEVKEILTPGMPVCSWQQPEFALHSEAIAPGGRLLLYTDGLDNIQTSEKTLDELKLLLASKKYTGQALLDAVMASHASSVIDDITLLLTEREA